MDGSVFKLGDVFRPSYKMLILSTNVSTNSNGLYSLAIVSWGSAVHVCLGRESWWLAVTGWHVGQVLVCHE